MKKFTALLLILFTVLCTLPLTVSASPVLVAGSGDVDGNGAVNEFDYLVVKRAYFNTYTLSDDEFSAADVDQNDSVDQMDYLYIKRHYFGTFVIGGTSTFEGTLAAELIESLSFKDELTSSSFTRSQEAEQCMVLLKDTEETPDFGVLEIKMYLIDTYEKYASVKQYFTQEQTIDETFFDENLLVSSALTAVSSDYHYDFVSAVAEGGKITLSLAQCDPYYISDSAYFEHLITVALKKSEVKGYDSFDISVAPVFHILDKDPTEFYVTEPTKTLSIEDSQSLATFLESIEWTECDLNTLPKYDYDYHLVRDSLYHYDSESGTIYNEYLIDLATLSDEEKAVLEGYLQITE